MNTPTPLLRTAIGWDWKSSPDVSELQQALRPFGIVVTADPRCEGSDQYGYLFSNRPLTREELSDVLDEEP
jgi:hypothetical protein